MKLSKKELEQVSGAVITSFVNLHFLEEASRSGIFKHKTKNLINKVIKDLIEIESNYYSKIEEIDEADLGDKLVSNNLEFIDWILTKFTFNDFIKIQEICVAFSMDKAKLSRTSDEILVSNGSKLPE